MKPKPPGFGNYTREEFVRRLRAGKDWHEEVRQADLKRIREKLEDQDGKE